MRGEAISRRIYGAHFTPRMIFKRYVAPLILDDPWRYVWVDMFAGRGDLILPILEYVPRRLRAEFFREHMYLFDIQGDLVEEALMNAIRLGVPRRIAEENIMVRDTIKNYPSFLLKLGLPVYHVTNPPYLYLGYISKSLEARRYLSYFEGENKGYQDLYQLALINDARHSVSRMIYVLPSNFLYGFSVSNKIRIDLLREYRISRVVVFENSLFDTTGMHVALCFFERKDRPAHEPQEFRGIKVKPHGRVVEREYRLLPKYKYRAGAEFDCFADKYRARNPVRPVFHLHLRDLLERSGNRCLEALDANSFSKAERNYRKIRICLDEQAYSIVKGNLLFLRTLDTGRPDGRAGLYVIREAYGVDAVVVTRSTYRTHPIHVVFKPGISIDDQLLLKDYFNSVLEYLRLKTDSDFMTTYKYSKSPYTRKYLGLSQARKLIMTFPILDMSLEEKRTVRRLLDERDVESILTLIARHSRHPPPHHGSSCL